MSKAISELNALCDVLSRMRKPTASDSENQMYERFCKQPGTGIMRIKYVKNILGKIILVRFEYTTWLGMYSSLSVNTTKHY